MRSKLRTCVQLEKKNVHSVILEIENACLSHLKMEKAVNWLFRRHNRLESGECIIYSSKDAMVTNDIRCLASHRERSMFLLRLKESWISDYDPRSHKFHTATHIGSLRFKHTKPLLQEHPG